MTVGVGFASTVPGMRRIVLVVIQCWVDEEGLVVGCHPVGGRGTVLGVVRTVVVAV